MVFIFIFYLIVLEYNAPQDFNPHYTPFNIMPHNAPLLTGLPHGAKRPRVGALFVSSTTHGLSALPHDT
ncbi:hypothetical protein HanXRQr2_Chr13g0592791 [Helianthus annuus]|uniref:Uncharacterized protein n=1 Tax=Helianthus annuus TaxID=4232 RepID=A0A9K3EHK3_HELAN|nr:hypothetical protein HanXRQr2_Chr13g0592791 [Helianthus annuus]